MSAFGGLVFSSRNCGIACEADQINDLLGLPAVICGGPTTERGTEQPSAVPQGSLEPNAAMCMNVSLSETKQNL